MTGGIVVFLGPSLPERTAAQIIPHARLAPPAAYGDLLAAAQDAETIVLIDGLFEGVRSVWHKEILWALQRGVQVIGASSMGALRAAECATFGMEPVGEIAAAYVDGRRTKDSDVALAHAGAEDGWRPLSEALVNVEATLDAALAAGVISGATADELRAAAATQFYAQRTWSTLLATVRSSPEITALSGWLPTGRVDQKAIDACAALRSADGRGSGASSESWRLSRTIFLEQALVEASSRRFAKSYEHLVDELRLDPPQHRVAMLEAKLRLLAATLADRAGAVLSNEDHSLALTSLLHRRGLRTHHEVAAWAAAERLEESSLRELLSSEAALAWAEQITRPAEPTALVQYLRAHGRTGEAAGRAEHKQAILMQHGYDDAQIAISATDDEALSWLWSALGIEPPGDVDAFLAEHHYGEQRELADAARRERLYRRLVELGA